MEPLPLAANSSAPPSVYVTHAAAVDQIRAALPHQTIGACTSQAEAVSKIGDTVDPCGLARVTRVQEEFSLMQQRYCLPNHTIHREYAARQMQLVTFRKMLRAEVGDVSGGVVMWRKGLRGVA